MNWFLPHSRVEAGGVEILGQKVKANVSGDTEEGGGV